MESLIVNMEVDKQDERNWQLAVARYENPVSAYEEMSAAVDVALDPSTDINNLPKEVQDWLRAT